MSLERYFQSLELQPLIKEIGAEHHLFRQGELGNSTYLILDGMVQLFDESNDEPHLVGTFGPGQFFGEKSMLSSAPYQRHFSAVAQTRTWVLEFKLKDIPLIQSVIPDFMVSLFQSAAQRLDRAYYMIRVLRSENQMERLIHCIFYFYRSPGLEVTAGRYVPLTVDDIHYLINMDKGHIERCLDELSARGALIKRPNRCYLLRSESSLMEALQSSSKEQTEPKKRSA